uniref:Uncharacterized protein n=1 Tax=Meloidogyne incognita TaxID=6306 RepID=A0A914MVI6_MELIC
MSTEDGGNSQITSMTRITSSHHILSIKHLFGQFRNILSLESNRTFGCEWSKSRHEEVKSRKRHHIDSQLAKVCIQLTRKTKARSNSRHCIRN